MFINIRLDSYIDHSMDDFAIYSSGIPHLTTLIKDIKSAFEITNLRKASFSFCIHITYSLDGIPVSQKVYIWNVSSQCGMENLNTRLSTFPNDITLRKGNTKQPKDQVTRQQLIIVSVMYLITSTRPDLVYRI